MAAWAQALATVVAVVVGGLIAYFLRDQQKAKIHEKRLDAYARLWELTKKFRINAPSLDGKGRKDLVDELTNWYYQPGGGMLLMDRTLPIFLGVRGNLTCDLTAFAPSSWQALLSSQEQDEQGGDRRRFLLLQRQFSLLRTQLKNDCAIYFGKRMSGDPLYRPYDLDFLEGCGLQNVGIWREATKKARDIDERHYLKMLEERYQGAPDISSIRLG